MNTIKAITAAAFAVVITSAAPVSAAKMDIVDTAAHAGSFKTLLAAAEAANLVDALKAEGPITVFAPTDEAFAKLPEGTVENLLKPENVSKLQAVLKYHVVAGSVMSTEAIKLDSAPTLLGQMLAIQPKGNTLAINDAKVVSADIEASNGVIHVIDNVLIPADLVTVAASDGSFNTLAAALEAAGLVDTLKNGGPFTVFAPTDEAFSKLPESLIAELLMPANKDKLVEILTYHVVPGVWTSGQVAGLESAPTVNGMAVPIDSAHGKVMVGGSKVIATDIEAFNGVIHVIDTVMVPDSGEKSAPYPAKDKSSGCSCDGH
jgi:uncharacterized surface protein with fasciclin (FAS1) repeats